MLDSLQVGAGSLTDNIPNNNNTDIKLVSNKSSLLIGLVIDMMNCLFMFIME